MKTPYIEGGFKRQRKKGVVCTGERQLEVVVYNSFVSVCNFNDQQLT